MMKTLAILALWASTAFATTNEVTLYYFAEGCAYPGKSSGAIHCELQNPDAPPAYFKIAVSPRTSFASDGSTVHRGLNLANTWTIYFTYMGPGNSSTIEGYGNGQDGCEGEIIAMDACGFEIEDGVYSGTATTAFIGDNGSWVVTHGDWTCASGESCIEDPGSAINCDDEPCSKPVGVDVDVSTWNAVKRLYR